MKIEIALLISVITVCCTIYATYRSSRDGDTKDIEAKAVEKAEINVKLDQIGSDVRDIKYDISAVKRDVQGLTERMIIVEQSTKSAHKRIDEIIGKEE